MFNVMATRLMTKGTQMTFRTFRNASKTLFHFTSLTMIATLPAHGVLVEWKVSEGGNGHFYEAVAFQSPINWQTARNDAIAKNGDLVSISSAAENDFVFGLIDSPDYWAPAGPHHYGPWIGGYQIDSSSEPGGNWAWTDESTWGFVAWASGQPDNAGSVEHHAHYFVPAPIRDKTWNDWVGTGLLIKGYVLESLSANLDGDFDLDGDVDGHDFLKWQRGELSNPPSQSDLDDWETNYGMVAPLPTFAAAVPEPATWLALLVGIMSVLFCRDVAAA